jgi:competence protein ComEA
MRTLAMTCAAIFGLAPAVGHTSAAGPLPGPPVAVPVQAPAPLALIDLNTALKQRLESLPGIDASKADAIIRGRPYAHPDELVRRKIIPPAIYDRIKERLIADGQRP